MPLGRNARQRRPRPPKFKSNAYVPQVDIFGTLRLGEFDARVRLIEYAPNLFAAFRAEDPEHPLTFAVDEYHLKGRNLNGTLSEGVGEFAFQKAGCGCETPYNLRGARSPLLAHVPGMVNPAPGLDEAYPDSEINRFEQEYPTSDELTEQLLDLPGATP